jgi:hypothetical protein
LQQDGLSQLLAGSGLLIRNRNQPRRGNDQETNCRGAITAQVPHRLENSCS